MRTQLLKWLVHMAAERRAIVAISSVMITVGAFVAAGQLKFDMRWSTLLPESLPVVQEFKKIDESFLQPSNMIVAISTTQANPEALERVTREATEILQAQMICQASEPLEICKAEQRYARHIYGPFPEPWLSEHALRLAKPKDARRAGNMLADPRLLPYLERLNDDFEAEYTDADNVQSQERRVVSALDAVERFVRLIDAATRGAVDEGSNDRRDRRDRRVNDTVRDLTIGRPFLFSLDNTMSLIMVGSAVPSDDIETTPLIDRRIETLLEPLAAANPQMRIERTGMTAIGRDEMDSIGPETQMITLVALGLIIVLLVWNFRSAVTPLLALVPIVVGIVWAMGVIGLTLGWLNMITAMIMVVLLGLGIDFSIHLTNRFHEELAAGASVPAALELAIGDTGVGVITGAMTTAVAFFTLMIAETKGVSQFGFCAGTGVLTTLLAVLWVLPALLAWWATRRAARSDKPVRAHDFSAVGGLAVTMARLRLPLLVVAALATGAGLWAGGRLDWEWNFLNLEAEGLRSVELQDEIIDKFKLSVSVALVTTDTVETSRELREKLKAKRLIGDIDDISQWVSRPDYGRSRPHIVRLQEALGTEKPPHDFRTASAQKQLAREVDRLWANLVELQALAFTGGQDRVFEKAKRLVATRDVRDTGRVRRLADRLAQPQVDWPEIDRLAVRFGTALRAQARLMARHLRPVALDDVPPDILAKYTSRDREGFLMQILPKHNLYEKRDLETFQTMAASVDPNVTGTPQMILQMNLETLREGKLAAGLALVVIFVVLLLDFRRPLIAVLTLLPLALGLALTLGVMWLTGEKLNYINMIGLPVIIGIGVDDGVHFFHRYLKAGRGNMRPAVSSVGQAMIMSSLTTMIGFGSLMLYLMRGMASMGRVLFVGVGMCLLVTLTVLPALAGLFEHRIFPPSTKSTEESES